MSTKITGFYRFAQNVLRPIMTPWVKIDAQGTENIPENGPYLLVVNHLSAVDPLSLCWFYMKRKTKIRFLAKKSMFSVPVMGKIFAGMGLIPVDREVNPAQSLEAATKALKDGDIVAIWPEGTFTQDPDQWPMSFKTGAARLALDTGVPVIPIAQWGAQFVKGPYSSKIDFRPGRTIRYQIMPPVDLSDLMSEQGSDNHEAVKEATSRMHTALTKGVAQLRGLEPPTRMWQAKTKAGPWWEKEGKKLEEKKAKKAGK